VFYNKILQIISSSFYEDDETSVPEIETHSDIESLVKALEGELTLNPSVVEFLLKNPNFKQNLESQGWINAAQAERVAEMATLGNQFFTYDTSERYSAPRRIDFDKLTDYDAKTLAKDETVILCTLTKGSLSKLNSKVYKSYLKAKKKVEEQKTARQKSAETRKKNAQAKRVEAARKLLLEAGELDKK